MPIAGEVLRFDLSSYRSRVTKEMAQVRLRLTARAFGVGPGLVPANVVGDTLEVDAGVLAAANAAVRRRLDAGPDGAVVYVRALRVVPAPLDVLGHAHYQALGALKFCLPGTLRAALVALLDDTLLVDALLAPDGPTLWSELRGQELALAELRRTGAAERYRRRLEQFQREYGYLYAEDVDFREQETLDALDARMATVTDDAARLEHLLAGDRARKCEARRRFAEADVAPLLVSHVLLARALAEHEDLNRRAKMRLLRDLRDRAEVAGLDIGRDGLEAVVGAEPLVLPST